MNRNTKIRLAVVLLLSAAVASADVANGFDEALASAERASEDKARDAARQPKEVLEFVGIGEGMTVLDVAASTGWYTEVLAAAVGPDGRVIAPWVWTAKSTLH